MSHLCHFSVSSYGLQKVPVSVKTFNRTMFSRRKLIRDLMAGRSDSYGHLDIGHSGGAGYDVGHSGGGGYGHSGGGYGHSGGGGYDGGYGHSSGYGGGGGYDHPITYSHDSYGGSYGGYGKMDCPGIPIALLLTTLLGIGVLGFILLTKIQGAGRRKRNAYQDWSSLLPLEDFLKILDFGRIFSNSR